MAMARPIHAKTTGLSLGALVEHYGIGVKDNTALVATKGKRLEDFSVAELRAMAKYNKEDTDQCYALLRKLVPQTNKFEVRLIDATIRMLVDAKFVPDRDLLKKTLRLEQHRKRSILDDLAEHIEATTGEETDAAGVKKTLNSSAKLSALLQGLGVDPPTKPSPVDPEVRIPAFAKTDEDFVALQNHSNPLVSAAVEARLGIKSTILESRLSAFLAASAAHPGGLLPIPLRYYGADTTGRWSGWEYNPQNMNRIIPGLPRLSDALRNSLCAPEDHLIVVADQSGIELRVNLTLWQVPYAMEAFAEDPAADLYKPMASDVLGVPVEGMPREVRQAGKAMHLGCGFGLGSRPKYVAVARQMAQIEVSLDDADAHIRGWRHKHPEVVRGWKICHAALSTMLQLDPDQESAPIDPWGMIVPTSEGFRTPRGMIRYPDLALEQTDEGEEFRYGRHRTRIYAGKVDENIVQHLAGYTLAGVTLSVADITGFLPSLKVHDELIYVVPKSEAYGMLAELHKEMRKPPKWWPELVTWSEGQVAERYGEAK